MKTATLHAVIGSLAALIMANNVGTASAAPLIVTTGITGTTAPVASPILPVGYYGHGDGYGHRRGYGHGYGYGYGHRRYYGYRNYYRRYNYYPGAYYGYRRYYRPYDCYNW